MASTNIPVIFASIEYPVQVRTWKDMQNDTTKNGIVVTFTSLIGASYSQTNTDETLVKRLLQTTPAFICSSAQSASIKTTVTGHVDAPNNAILLQRIVNVEHFDQQTEFDFKDNRTTTNQAAERLIVEQQQKKAIGLEFKFKLAKNADERFTIQDKIVVHHYGYGCGSIADSRESEHSEETTCAAFILDYKEMTKANNLTLNLDRSLDILLPTTKVNWQELGYMENKSMFSPRDDSLDGFPTQVIGNFLPRLMSLGNQSRDGPWQEEGEGRGQQRTFDNNSTGQTNVNDNELRGWPHDRAVGLAMIDLRRKGFQVAPMNLRLSQFFITVSLTGSIFARAFCDEMNKYICFWTVPEKAM